jgi:hypothetical protein
MCFDLNPITLTIDINLDGLEGSFTIGGLVRRYSNVRFIPGVYCHGSVDVFEPEGPPWIELPRLFDGLPRRHGDFLNETGGRQADHGECQSRSGQKSSHSKSSFWVLEL